MKYDNILTAEEYRAYNAMPVPFCVFLIYGAEADFLTVSEGFCREFGTNRELLLQSGREVLPQLFHPEDLKQFRQDIADACLNPEAVFEGIYRIKGRTDDYRFLSGKGRIARKENGRYLLYAFFSDVHDETLLRREEASERQRKDILFSDILSTTQTAIFWKDADRRFIGVNKAFLDYYGFENEDAVLGKNDEEMGWHSEPQFYKNDELRVLQEGISTCRVAGKCIARGGERNIVASKSPLIINGKIVGLVGSFEDVTRETHQQEEIRRLNKELAQQIEDHNLLMNISEVGIVKISLKDYTLLDYNDAMCRMIGYSREEYETLFHHDMKLYFSGKYGTELDMLRNTAEEALKQGRKSFSLHIKIPVKDGGIQIAGVGSFSEFNPESGKPAYMVAVYRDVTDILETQRKLERAEQEAKKTSELEIQVRRMHRMINGVPFGLGALRITDGNPDGMVQLNRYFMDRINIELTGEDGASLEQFLHSIHPDDRERCRSDYRQFISRRTLTAGQYRFSDKTGHYYWVDVRATAIKITDKDEIAYFIYTNIDELKKTEERLKESHRFYREVVQAAKLSTWDYDIADHTITMSRDNHTNAVREVLGMPVVIRHVPESMAGSISEEDRPAFLRMYREVEAGRNASCEVWYKPENGREPRCERITYICVESPDGTPSHAIGFTQNITAEKKVEERYEREIGYLRETDANNLVAKGHYNLTRNLVLEYTSRNDSYFKIESGITYDAAFRQLISMPYKEKERLEIRDVLDRRNLMTRYQQGQMQSSLLYRRCRKGQLPLWISMNIHTYMMPETGDLECFSYAYDITDEKESDEIMGLISEEEFDYIGLIYTEAEEFEFLKKSPQIRFPEVHQRTSYAECCGYVRRDFVNAEERSQFDAAADLENIVKELNASGKYISTYRRTEGAHVLCKQLDFAWLDKNAGIVLVVRSDVTAVFEREQEQIAHVEAAKLEAERANEAKSTFLSSMSHDLRTPLNGVLGFTGLALKEENPEKKQDYLGKIDASGRLLLNLVNDTLELSRIESGKAVLEPEAVLPDDLVPAVVTSLRPSAELKKIELDTDFSSVPAFPVWCDKIKLQKIALNLISNAIKYTPEGGRVTVSVIPSEDQDGYRWLLSVADTGIGMSEEFMHRMYEPFSQEKRSESVNVVGTGLGLSIVKKYVDLMGGKIEVTSRIHEGTRWAVSIPIREAKDGAAQKEDLNAAEKIQQLNDKRVLLCEDNYMNTEIAAMLLQEKKMIVETAENGKIGLDQFRTSPVGYYDAVLMDIRMPVMDGLMAARQIRALKREDAETVPIIAMTADAFEESIREAMAAGMNDYVTKPVDPHVLYTRLQNAIAKRKDR